jgi:hypothetical protein
MDLNDKCMQKFSSKTSKGSDHLGDIVVDVKIIRIKISLKGTDCERVDRNQLLHLGKDIINHLAPQYTRDFLTS